MNCLLLYFDFQFCHSDSIIFTLVINLLIDPKLCGLALKVRTELDGEQFYKFITVTTQSISICHIYSDAGLIIWLKGGLFNLLKV